VPQKALYGAEGVCSENRFIRILYDFGNIVVINNRDADGCEGEEFITGARFNYPNLWGFDDIGYDCQTVTGVFFIKKE